ncbi:ATP-dependent Zn protease [Kamptonema sp. UHCC 0994]|uniref:ATP-dependent Zn protease n=1 Tax=Kamptonema sp. UHCC 0994 TaxID=3031329 RepID=UPI0023B94F4D|nr:ATP-dependent Zn protease [Kamptonema sp. UHCC 0994]MDF0553688.1 ATP-dependent Zn protease [Kamptonema sp. UHCC 0994]
MRQTSLNAIAIAIFAVTISTLLGPALNLPQAVPAIATFCLLGLAAFDTFQLQGQGTAILSDLLAGNSDERGIRILRHEAGHFLVAYLLEIPVSGYALNAWEAFKQGQTAQGGVRFEDQELATKMQKGTFSVQLLDRYFTVWMAGIAAENLVYGNAEGGAEDRDKIRLILSQLRRPASEFKQKENRALLQARNLIENHKLAYEALVEAMKKREAVAECYRVIQQNL